MLQIKDIYKKYGDNHVLKGVTFNVLPHEIKALIGINGAGKSTLVEIICGVKKCDSGTIILNGVDVTKKTKTQKDKYDYGYMPQSFCLFSDLTVKENLRYVAAVYNLKDDEVDKIIVLCKLTSHKNVLVKDLSGGYKQLLSVAVSIIHKPKLLILDEPTSNMDPLFRREFWDIVKRFRADGGTVLVITHYAEELLECDSFVCLSNGVIKIDSTTDKYKKDNFIDIEKILNTTQREKK